MRVTDEVYKVAKSMEWIGIVALLFTMVVTASDVVMGLFRRPILGAYDLAGLGSGIAIAFSLAITSWKKQHIVVDTFSNKLPAHFRVFWAFLLQIVTLVVFAFLVLYLFKRSADFQRTGEVMGTLATMPLWIIALVLGVGCLGQCLVSIANMVDLIRKGDSRD